MDRLVSLLGFVSFMLFAWLLSSNKRIIPWRVIAGGVLLQFIFALLVLKTAPGLWFFELLNDAFMAVADCARAGTEMVLGKEFFHQPFAQKSFLFTALPTIIFFSALMSVLYYYGIMQWVIKGTAWVMRYTLGTSGAETLSAAANIFAGQTEAPLLIRPYLPRLTNSELMAVMVGGFANIAGSVMAAFVQMGISAGHLMTASVISAPASLLIAKLMEPETRTPETTGKMKIEFPKEAANVIDAAANGTADGLILALNVLAMLIAFLALIKLADLGLYHLGLQVGNLVGQKWHWSLEAGLGYLFAPIAWLMGVETQDCLEVGQLLGLKTIANEFLAYEKLQSWMRASPQPISERSVVLATYALCGFANFASIGIQIGGLGPLAPQRKGDLARLGFRAMIGGTLTNCMMACVVGIVSDHRPARASAPTKASLQAVSMLSCPAPLPTANEGQPYAMNPSNIDPRDGLDGAFFKMGKTRKDLAQPGIAIQRNCHATATGSAVTMCWKSQVPPRPAAEMRRPSKFGVWKSRIRRTLPAPARPPLDPRRHRRDPTLSENSCSRRADFHDP